MLRVSSSASTAQHQRRHTEANQQRAAALELAGRLLGQGLGLLRLIRQQLFQRAGVGLEHARPLIIEQVAHFLYAAAVLELEQLPAHGQNAAFFSAATRSSAVSSPDAGIAASLRSISAATFSPAFSCAWKISDTSRLSLRPIDIARKPFSSVTPSSSEVSCWRASFSFTRLDAVSLADCSRHSDTPDMHAITNSSTANDATTRIPVFN
jgi:hypothetical protein